MSPDLLVVYGDVNSTVAAALVAAKLNLPVGHVEAGLRSFDRTMPEEINRVITDQLATLLFTPSIDGNDNLLREGIKPEGIHLVGNVMIDTLVRLAPAAASRRPAVASSLGAEPYGLVTLHRPSNVDDLIALRRIVEALAEVSEHLPLLFPVHPRTRERLAQGSVRSVPRLHFLPPLGYLDFLSLLQRATVVITDSGGVQEETTFLGVPCLTMRPNTERPVTVELGTNTLIGDDTGRMSAEVERVLVGGGKRGVVPPLWDGQAARRIADVLRGYLFTDADGAPGGCR